MDKATLQALKKSIKKWENIVAGTGQDEGVGNCALCKLFWPKPFVELACKGGCPVFNKTQRKGCVDTPYTKWFTHQRDVHSKSFPLKVMCPECLVLAGEELKFLKDLMIREVPR